MPSHDRGVLPLRLGCALIRASAGGHCSYLLELSGKTEVNLCNSLVEKARSNCSNVFIIPTYKNIIRRLAEEGIHIDASLVCNTPTPSYP